MFFEKHFKSFDFFEIRMILFIFSDDIIRFLIFGFILLEAGHNRRILGPRGNLYLLNWKTKMRALKMVYFIK